MSFNIKNIGKFDLTIVNCIRSHLNDKDSAHRRILIGFLWVSAFVFIGKLAGAGKEIIIAWRYGVSSTVDAYVFTLTFMSLPIGIWFSILSAVLIPLLSQLRHNTSNEVSQFRAELFGFTLLIGFCISIVMYLGLFWFIKSGNSGLPDTTKALALDMLPLLSLIIPFGFVISLLSTFLLSLEKHRNTLLESVPAVIIITALLLPSGIIPEPLVWGTVAGFALHMVSLALPLYHACELNKPKFSFRSPAWQGFWAGIGIMAIGQVLMSFTSIIDQLFAARLESGSISILNYANRIMALILGLGATAIGRSVFPVLSQLAVKPEAKHRAHSVALKWSALMFGFGILMIVVLWSLAYLIIEIIFERGAFTSEDTKQVVFIFQLLLLQLPFYFSSIVLIQLILSLKQYKIILIMSAFGLMAKVILSYFLIVKYQINGLVVATSIMYLSIFIYLVIQINQWKIWNRVKFKISTKIIFKKPHLIQAKKHKGN